jgi:hypothetical protein
MSQAPGFLEWQKAEDKRILLEGIKKHEAAQEAKLIQKEKEDAENNINSKYYERLAYNAHKAWSAVNFSQGKEREAYMEAHKILSQHMVQVNTFSDTSPHTPSE